MPALSWSDRAISGFVGGVVFGIALSTVAAFYITHSPVPFVNKVQRPTENVNPAANGQLPDPNKPLYSNRAALPVVASPATVPGAEQKTPVAAAAAPAPAAPAPETSGRLMLQTGAFKSEQDADSMRARLALLGLDARVSQVTQDAGATVLYRVRIGPYRELDDLSGIKRTLAENGIEAQVVHTP